MSQMSRDTHAFIKGAGQATMHEDPEVAESLRRTFRQIIRTVIATLIFGVLVVPILTLAIGVIFYGITQEDAATRLFVGIGFSLVLSILYLFVGVSLGCLLAPPEFFRSQAGEKWIELIGTSDMVAARIICGLVVVIGGFVMFGVAAFLMTMAPTN
ncbi:hypothetical protein GC170_20790 [bacterium]|nr:hypothetical protein [bacterium]